MPLLKLYNCTRIVLQCNKTRPLVNSNLHQLHNCKFLSSEPRSTGKVLKTEKDKFSIYVVRRYIEYVKNYTKVLEVRFPTAVKMYRVFSVGIKDFLIDLKTYISLRLKVSKDRGFSNMSRQEIELYEKMPSDMLRIAPVLILSAIPFGNYIIFPLAFIKPKLLLCSHFWSIQQRVEFSTQDLTERLRYNKPTFRALQAKLDELPDGELKNNWQNIIALLGSGVHPTPNDVIKCKELFSKKPYALEYLTRKHMGHLLKMHGCKKGLFRTKKLKYRALLLREMDKAIMREGGVAKMNTECLRKACHIRGLYGAHLANQDMREWLTKWLTVSHYTDSSTYSLLLHCPIFFAYNHPQNWVLIY